MKFTDFFVERPIFAVVLSVMLLIVGGIALRVLPLSEYPAVSPPTVVVRAAYPGANPKVIAENVAAPLEQEINGVEGMMYMSSQATTDGRMNLTVTFEQGVDVDLAQVQVQNRVSRVLPRLPPEVQRIGVVTDKTSPDMLMVAHITSPKGSRSPLYLSNYALLHVRDELSRLDGVGNRPELSALELMVRNEQAALSLAKNSLLPDLALTGSLAVATSDTAASDAQQQLGTRFDDQLRWSAGVTFSHPLGNRAAKSEHRAKALSLARAEAALADARLQIEQEVRAAVRTVNASVHRIEATRRAEKLAAEQLAAERLRLEAGTSTSFEVLRLETDLASARNARIRATTDYTVLKLDLERAVGRLSQRVGKAEG